MTEGTRERGLAGLRIVVTRAAAQVGGLAEALEQAGAAVSVRPLIRILPASDDEALACDVVRPGFCEAMVALAEAHRGRPIQGAFQGRWFYLTMPKRGDQFRLGSLFRPLAGLKIEAQKVLEDVRIVHRVIDTLHGAGR